MATIQVMKGKRGRRYKVAIRRDGHRCIYKTFPTVQNARRFAAQVEDDIEAGRFGIRDEATRHTLAEAIDRYIAVEIPKKRRQAKDRLRHLEFWREKFGNKKLSEITPAAIAAIRDELHGAPTVRKTPRTAATVNRITADLSHVFTVIVKDFGWLLDSPSSRVRKLREPRGRVRYLSEQELETMLRLCRERKRAAAMQSRDQDAMPQRPFYLLAILLLALSTGMRRGEIENLKWDDVDWVRNRIILEHTKNDERRAVPLVGDARAELQELHANRIVGTDYVFASDKEGYLGQPKTFQREWKDLLKAAELKDFRFHDLRHSCASYLAMNGCTPTDIAAVLGHKTLAMVRRYAHLSDSHIGAVVEKMTARFIDQPSGSGANDGAGD
ncbi:MAG TPA: site-specific integrase [Usitatibacter sp.]|nr:site-specific integrase [Usitatibacter sp.]